MGKFRRIAVATDFSNYSNEALADAVYLAKKLKSRVYLLHVFEAPVYSDIGVAPNMQPEVHRWIRGLKSREVKRLEALAGKIKRQGVAVRPCFLDGKPFEAILSAAKKLKADLIVLGTHGRTGLAHVLMGSVAERVVRQAACPVLTVRPKALRPRKR